MEEKAEGNYQPINQIGQMESKQKPQTLTQKLSSTQFCRLFLIHVDKQNEEHVKYMGFKMSEFGY